MNPGIKNYFRVPVIIDNNHDNTIRKNLIIGHLEYILSFVPSEVAAKTESNINKQKPSLVNVSKISEKSTSENEEKNCANKKFGITVRVDM